MTSYFCSIDQGKQDEDSNDVKELENKDADMTVVE